MLKKWMVLILSAALATFCACTPVNDQGSESLTDNSLNMYEDENGTVYYNFGESTVEPDAGALIERSYGNQEVSAPKKSISFSEAEQLLDSCAFEEFALPSKVADYKKLYNKTVEVRGKAYYSVSFYAEQNSVRMFVGNDAYVACDGTDVLAVTILGTYNDVEIGGSKNDKELSELYPGAEITPVEALFVINSIEPISIGLKEKLINYTFEFGEGLSDAKNLSCYKIMPKLSYEHTQSYQTPIYVAADGSNTVMIFNGKTDEFEVKS